MYAAQSDVHGSRTERADTTVRPTGSEPPELPLKEKEDSDGGTGATNNETEKEEEGSAAASSSGDSVVKEWRHLKRVGPSSDPYALSDVLGSGSFGVVFRGVHERTKQPVAVKIEKPDNTTAQIERSALRLLWETHNHLGSVDRGELRIPPVIWSGECSRGGQVIVMPLFGATLHDAVRKHGANRGLPPHLAVCVLWECLIGLEQICDAFIVHRDIKPPNMLLGRPGTVGAGRIFMVDFGLATTWEPETERQKARCVEELGYTAECAVGTARFTSTHTHKGCPPAPRDDLESVAYVFIGLLRGGKKSLPWVGAAGNARGRKRFRRVYSEKQRISTDALLEPIEDRDAAEIARMVLRAGRCGRFHQAPPYAALRTLLRTYLDQHGYEGMCPTTIIAEQLNPTS